MRQLLAYLVEPSEGDSRAGACGGQGEDGVIGRIKRRQKHRHSVRPEGVRLRWKRGGQWIQWTSPKYRTGSLTITLTPEPGPVIGVPFSPNVFVSNVQIHYTPALG